MNLAQSLRKLLGPGVVASDEPTLTAHAKDRWFASRQPDVVVLAKKRAHVEKTLQFANAHGIPVTTRGAGYGYVGGCVPSHGGIDVRQITDLWNIDPPSVHVWAPP